MTAQPNNPLMARPPSRLGRVTLEMLTEYADTLNTTRWVRDSGLPYFVNRRFDEATNTYTHFLDRKMHQTAPPSPGAR
jgi:hypothetical protein